MYIYCILNIINGKIYIGQTKQQPSKRFNQHKHKLNSNKHSNQYLQFSYNKHGASAFDFFILDKDISAEEIDNYEIMLINWFKSINLSYNIEGGGNKNKSLSIETIAKIKEARKKQIITAEHKLNTSKTMKGVPRGPMGDEHKKKMTETKRAQSSLLTIEEKIMKYGVNARPFTIQTPDGDIIKGFNATQFCRDNKLNKSTFLKVLRGEYKQHRGYTLPRK